MPHWLTPTNWTPEWVSAIGGSSAAVFALVALIVTLALSGHQAKSLKVTIEALNAELAVRRREERAAREEQARQVKINWLGTSTMNNDGTAVVEHLSRNGLDPYIISGVEIQNRSQDPIRQVSVASEDNSAIGWVTGWDSELSQGRGMVPPGGTTRFYWSGHASEASVFVYFADVNNVRWRLHRREGLSEVTEEA